MSATNRQHRLDTLKIREAEGTLTQKERKELDAIFAELDVEEAVALKPGIERDQAFIDSLLAEEMELETTIAQLQVIVTTQKQQQDAHHLGQTPEGMFYIQRLHLNRPQLVAHRLQKREIQRRLNKVNELRESLRDLRHQMALAYSIFQETMDEIERETKAIEEDEANT